VEGEEMTRAIKITFTTAAILGLGCGGYLGYRSAVEIGDSLESIQYIGPAKVASDFARTQFLRADSDHVRQAVMLQIQLLERLELADNSFHAQDLTFAYVRLAMIEKAAGRPEAAQRALAQAKARDKRDHFRNVELTDDELKSVVERLDRAFDKP
jgi:hypothetical protein